MLRNGISMEPFSFPGETKGLLLKVREGGGGGAFSSASMLIDDFGLCW